MTPDDLARIALRYETLMADAMLRALGVARPPKRKGRTSSKHDRYRGTRKAMRQRHGVRGL